MMRIALVSAPLLLAACAEGDSLRRPAPPPEPAAMPVAPPSEPLPAATGRDAAALDATTEEDRAAALAAGSGGGRALGTAVASLGDPTDQGIWVKTPLVSAETSGRVEWTETGKTIAVTLRPADDASGATQISLAALRLLEAPLTALPELVIYTR